MEETVLNRSMPSNKEAEGAVIGSMIMNRDAIVTTSEMLTRDDFYYSQYGILFEAMIELYNEGSPVDLITLQNRLREKNVPPEISSLEFVKDLFESNLTSVNVKHYARIVAEKAVLRRLIKVTEGIADHCYQDSENLDVILEDTEKNIFGLFRTAPMTIMFLSAKWS